MVNCPNCKKAMTKPVKKWKYGHFIAEAYACDKCGTQFREYIRNGKHSFMLKLKKGKGFVKV